MTNEELIDKIKTAIEKRIALIKELVEREGTCDFALGSIDALQGLLDTVISPIFDECVSKVDPKAREEVSRNIELEEEIAGMYQALFGTDVINRKEMLYLDTFEAIARHFARWKNEQFMKEAVECTVTTNLANRPVIYLDQLKGFQYGDKVRVIVLPKEDEK